MNFPQFFGGSNTAYAKKAAVERTVNLTMEKIESGAGESDYTFYRSPGLRLVATAGGGISRGAVELNDHWFQIVGDTVYDLTDWNSGDGSLVVNRTYGPIANDSLPVPIAIDQQSCLFVSGGILYAINAGALTTPVLTFTPIGIVKINNYWVALSSDLSQFYFSDDGLTWDPAKVQTAEADANLLQAMCVSSQQLVILGNRVTQTFYVGSNANTPFVPRTEAVITKGIKARASVRVIGGAMFWLAQSKSGQVTVEQSAGGPGSQSVSSLALEEALRVYQKNGTIEDAIGMDYSLGKKDFYRLTFPSANATWELDVMNGRWTEVPYWNLTLGKEERHRANTLVAAFGTIFAGDRANGQLYEFTPDAFTDAGDLIRCLRRCPHLIKEHKTVGYDRLFVGCAMGQGLDVALGQPGYDPQITMRFSDDGGETWSNEQSRSMGRIGQFRKPVPDWDSLGEGVDRVYELVIMEPTKIALTSAGFDAQVLLR